MLTEKMLADRKKGIMGSMAAIILGVARWGDLHWLYHWLIGNPTKPILVTMMMKLGNFLEPFVAILYTEETGRKLQKIHRTVWHKKHPYIGGHPDRIIRGDRNRGLEIKCVFQRGERDWEDGVPDYYVAQVMHYALCTGRKVWDFAVLFIANAKFEIYTVEFTKEQLDELRLKESEFWNDHILARKEPDVSARSADTLKTLWKTTDPEAIRVADEVTLHYFNERQTLKKSLEMREMQLKMCENKLRAHLREAETLVAPSGETLLTYRKGKSGHRRFNFNFKKEKENEQTHASHTHGKSHVAKGVPA